MRYSTYPITEAAWNKVYVQPYIEPTETTHDIWDTDNHSEEWWGPNECEATLDKRASWLEWEAYSERLLPKGMETWNDSQLKEY